MLTESVQSIVAPDSKNETPFSNNFKGEYDKATALLPEAVSFAAESVTNPVADLALRHFMQESIAKSNIDKADPAQPTQKIAAEFAVIQADTAKRLDLLGLTPKQVAEYSKHKDQLRSFGSSIRSKTPSYPQMSASTREYIVSDTTVNCLITLRQVANGQN